MQSIDCIFAIINVAAFPEGILRTLNPTILEWRGFHASE